MVINKARTALYSTKPALFCFVVLRILEYVCSRQTRRDITFLPSFFSESLPFVKTGYNESGHIDGIPEWKIIKTWYVWSELFVLVKKKERKNSLKRYLI